MLELSVACLAYVLHGEGATLQQKERIAAVVINSSKNIESLCDEVYRPNRYEYIQKMRFSRARTPSKKELLENELIALKVIQNKTYLKYNYHYFHDDRIDPRRNPFRLPVKEQVGNLYFY
jgi:hypothetical protein